MDDLKGCLNESKEMKEKNVSIFYNIARRQLYY